MLFQLTGFCRRAVCLPSDEEGVPSVVPVRLEEVEGLSSVRIYIPKDLRQPEARALGIKVTRPPYIPFLPQNPQYPASLSRLHVFDTPCPPPLQLPLHVSTTMSVILFCICTECVTRVCSLDKRLGTPGPTFAVSLINAPADLPFVPTCTLQQAS